MPPLGRAAGDRCGSCDMGPIFACRSNGRDATCADGFCSSEGLCTGLPLCPLGRYRPSTKTVQQSQALAARTHQAPGASTSQDDEYPEEEPDDAGCVACPGGRYGATVGLMDRECSGLCPAGAYCPPGSAGFEETPCSDASHYCPEGRSKGFLQWWEEKDALWTLDRVWRWTLFHMVLATFVTQVRRPLCVYLKATTA
jgi:hypothetical protein